MGLIQLIRNGLKGRGTQEALAKAREEALASIRGDRHAFVGAVMQADGSGSSFSPALVEKVLAEFQDIERRLPEANEDEVGELDTKAGELARLRAYVYSSEEVKIQGTRAIAEMEDEWHVPLPALRGVKELAPLLSNKDVAVARGALRDILEFYDFWSDYVEEYAAVMKKTAIALLAALIVTDCLGLYSLSRGRVILGLLLAGTAGSVVSVLSKLPSIAVSGESSTYAMRVIGRIGTGMAASIIGSGLLAAGVVSVTLPGVGSVTQLIEGCGNLAQQGHCGASGVLVLTALAMLFGFSERALASFEGSIFSRTQRSAAEQ